MGLITRRIFKRVECQIVTFSFLGLSQSVVLVYPRFCLPSSSFAGVGTVFNLYQEGRERNQGYGKEGQ